ncbi:MAG: DUF4214 domain-containing protein [Lachnospiraceae bacterium]|nr:DUF4214 domain-containing protein [Lachnospiraceae bacterium]
MKKGFRQIIASAIIMGMAVTLAAIPVYAADIAVASSGNVMEQKGQGYSLNYVYVDDGEIFLGDEQAVVVNVEGIQDSFDQIADLRLGCLSDNISKEYTYSEVVDDMIVFRFTPETSGSYDLQYIDIRLKTGCQRIAFSESQIQTTFQVIDLYGDADAIMMGNEIAYSSDDLARDMNEMLSKEMYGGTGPVVVVLDPGHDSLHCGAAGNGLREEELTLKIAQYCKEELEKYGNVKVYMTRNDGSCLNPASNAECMKARCRFAASVNADVLVSIHIDAGSDSRTGAMALVAKNGVYRDDLSTVTQDVGQQILDELTKIGFASRGLYIRMSDSQGEEFRYPNGATADWYSIVRNSIKNGVPGLIIEHGYISNPSDVAKYLNSDDKLKKIGIADATGIAEYFGLSGSASMYKVIEAMSDNSSEPYIDDTENISGFVAGLYHSVLGRTPSKAEVSSWVGKVCSENLTGSQLVIRFLNSEEFRNKQYSNEEYVERLYNIFLGRSSDPSGKAHWVSLLEGGTSRLEIAERIGNSPEFEELCGIYGMQQGNHAMQYVKMYPEIAEFATEYYQGLLNRGPDPSGLEHWTRSLIVGDKTAADLTRGFIGSPEFQGRNLSNEDFVEGLYYTYLGRASDPSGKEHWVGMLPTMSQEEKEAVIAGFLRSPEYKQHCDAYGISVGNWQ